MKINFIYVDLCFYRSAVGLWDHSHVRRFDDGAGHRFFWRLSSKFSDQLPDHVQQAKRFCNLGRSLEFLELTGNGGCALHVPPVEPVGESEPSFSCCLGGVHNLASDTCCKSLHREVDVFVKLGDLFSFQSIVLLSCGDELVLVPLLHLRSQSQHGFKVLVDPLDPRCELVGLLAEGLTLLVALESVWWPIGILPTGQAE